MNAKKVCPILIIGDWCNYQENFINMPENLILAASWPYLLVVFLHEKLGISQWLHFLNFASCYFLNLCSIGTDYCWRCRSSTAID